MSGTTLQRAEIPLPGGGAAVYNAGGLEYYRHAGWLGTARLETTPQRTAYTALAAVNPNDPQTWDAYSYVGDNPMFLTDPWGLHAVQCYVGGKTTSEPSAEACYKAGGMLVQPQSVTVTPGESEGPDLEPLFTLTFYGPAGLPTETSLVRTTLTGPTNRLTLILPSNPSGKACGGILAKGAVQTGLDAVAAIPVAGEAAATLHVAQATLEVVHSSAVVGSMAMSVATTDATGSAIGGTGIGLELVKQNAPALVLDSGEAIPLAGRFVAAGAVAWDLISTIRDYGACEEP